MRLLDNRITETFRKIEPGGLDPTQEVTCLFALPIELQTLSFFWFQNLFVHDVGRLGWRNKDDEPS